MPISFAKTIRYRVMECLPVACVTRRKAQRSKRVKRGARPFDRDGLGRSYARPVLKARSRSRRNWGESGPPTPP